MVNTITISGKVINVEMSHIIHGVRMYLADIECVRTSGRVDTVKVFFDKRFAGDKKEFMLVTGDIRECRFGNESIAVIHAYDVQWNDCDYDVNDADIEGVIIKVGRIKYSKGLQFVEVVLKCDRDNGYKSDFIPCAVWGMDALEVFDCGKGKKIEVNGRFQNKKHGTQVSARSITWR